MEFRIEYPRPDVGVLIWDLPEKSMNVMTLQGLSDLSDGIDTLLAADAVKAIVITSAKPDFAAGMDINVIASLKAQAKDDPESALKAGFRATHDLLLKIENASKPVVAALTGTALGIGYELALACHHIIAADNPKAKIGLPEISLGIFPGAGGTTRLVRQLGLMGAAPYLIDGSLLAPQKALAAGLVDALAPADQLLDQAVEAALRLASAPPVARHAAQVTQADAAFDSYAEAARMRPMGRAPGFGALIRVMKRAVDGPEAGLQAEIDEMAAVLLHPASTASMRTSFISRAALDKGARRPKAPDQSVSKLGVIGAGMMGSGIALVSAQAGINVVLLDASMEGAARGKENCAKTLNAAVTKGRMTEAARDAVLERITIGTAHSLLAGCDLVIEAVFEDIGVKAAVTQAAEAHLDANCIFATNTSTLPVSDLAAASVRPDNYLGIHFFSPVDRMALIEIIRGKKTSDLAVARALDYARQIRKTPILVNDARYFYANRCVVPYLNEALRMVGEGIDPARVETACRTLGMPVGALQLIDETSVDLGLKIAEASKQALGDAYPHDAADAVLAGMMSKGRLGRKTGKGFYDYDEKGRRLGLWQGFGDLWPAQAPQAEIAELEHRLVLVQLAEAIRALEEDVISDVREGDVAAVLGWGFAPWSGGPFGWADIQGARAVLDLFDDLAARHGPRFTAPALLRQMAKDNQLFYAA